MNVISLKGKALLFALALAALPVGMTSRASAAVVSSFDVSPTSILEGGSALLHLHLALESVPPDFEFLGGSVTLFSGLGTSSNFLIGVGGTTRDFTETFSYPFAGTYDPSFLVLGVFFGTEKTPPSQCANDCRIFGDAKLDVIAATPIPAALPLFGTGLGIMGLMGWWRKRRAEMAA
jgi:hypothetical protein